MLVLKATLSLLKLRLHAATFSSSYQTSLAEFGDYHNKGFAGRAEFSQQLFFRRLLHLTGKFCGINDYL